MTLRDWYATAYAKEDARRFAISRARLGMPVDVIAAQCGEPLIWVQWIVSTWWHHGKSSASRMPRHGWHAVPKGRAA